METCYRNRRIGERDSKCVLLCCLAENWTEEGLLQYGCPHIADLLGQEYLGGEPSWEEYSASSARSLWRPIRRDRFHWIAAGLVWWAAGVVSRHF